MFDWIKRLFGEGMIRFEMVTADGRKVIGRVPYIGDIQTLDTEEVAFDLINQCRVRYGEHVVKVRILDWY